MMKLVIIDDEETARETLANMINFTCKDVEIVGFGQDVKSGIEAIEKLNPNIVLLDVNMPDGTGFDLLSQIKPELHNFQIIFITAFGEHAVKAFRYSAIDFLLKPVNFEDLKLAIEKCKTSHKDEFKQKIETFSYNALKNNEEKKIVLKTQTTIFIVKIKDIIRCESDGGYTTFYTINKKNIMVTQIIKDFEDLLTEFGFFRIHRTHLINLAFVEKIDKGDSGCVTMGDNSLIPISRRRKDEFLTAIGGM